jgi:hypothetical protein
VRAGFVAVMLLALGAQTLWAAIANSTTWDESSLLTTGLAALRTGDFRMNKGAPPLMDMLSAVAAITGGAPPLPLDSPEWRAGQDDKFALLYFWRGAAAPHAPRLIFLARLPIIFVSMGLGLLVFVWGRQLYGWPAGALALGLYAFEPNLLAHSSLATSDLGAAAFSLLCVYAYWRYAHSPSRWALALAGIALGAAALTKFSGLLLLVVLVPLAVVADEMGRRRGNARRLSPWRLLAGLAAIVAIAAMTIWAGYGFSIEPVSGAPFAMRLPAGRFLSGVLTQSEHQKWGHLAYLMGWASRRGWWYYYPVAFAVKTSLPFMCLLGIALGLRRFKADEAFLVIPVAAFFIAAMVQSLDLGLRYILPIYPFLVIFAARTVARPWPAARPRWGGVVVGVLAAWVVVEALLYAPQYIPYFNELAGGPSGGSRYLADSNLDWGQDLKRLAAWQRRHPEAPTIHLAYFGFADPARYGVRAYPLPVGRPDWAPSPAWPLRPMPESWYRTAGEPRAGWIAVSMTILALDPRYAWLESYRPVARAGYSIWIYHIGRKPASSGSL